jgi:hypothetical protein
MSYSMHQIMAPVQAFALVAGLSACGGKLASIDTPTTKLTQLALQETLPVVPKTQIPFYDDLHDEEEWEDPFIDGAYLSMKASAMWRNCAMIPKGDDENGMRGWEIDCNLTFTEAGLELINQVLDIRERKRKGQYPQAKPIEDTQALFRFTG